MNGARCHFYQQWSHGGQNWQLPREYLEAATCTFAFSILTYDSYSRISELNGQAGKQVAWATKNKGMFVRARKDHVGYCEFRSADFSANTCLQLAAWITVGHLGVPESHAST
jgi:glutamine synthetase